MSKTKLKKKVRLQDMQYQGSERTKNENKEQRNIWLEDI